MCSTFLGVDARPIDECGVVLIPAPYDGTTSYRSGARNGPMVILGASHQVELFDVELRTCPVDIGIGTLGDYSVDVSSPEAAVHQVYSRCAAVHESNQRPFVLGGEHSVSSGAVRAAFEKHGKLSILQIDAHLDLRESYQGSQWSHACVARRMLEYGTIVPVGVRVACPEELSCVDQEGIRPFWASDLEKVSRGQWVENVLEHLTSPVYVTVDVDGFDPSVFRATGTPVPGGLSWYDVLTLLREVGQQRRVVGCDVVELAADSPATPDAFAAAQLVYKMVGYFWHR